jgi:hypothetical protein
LLGKRYRGSEARAAKRLSAMLEFVVQLRVGLLAM